MKRFEMVQVLLGSIYENISSYGGDGLDTSNVEKILDDLEEAGMLPPPNKEHFLEQVAVKIEEEHIENHGYPIGAKRAYYAKRGAVLALQTKWDKED